MFVLFVFELDYECKLIKTREMCSRIDMQTHVERLGLGFVSAYRGPAMSTDFGADRSICFPFRARTTDKRDCMNALPHAGGALYSRLG